MANLVHLPEASRWTPSAVAHTGDPSLIRAVSSRRGLSQGRRSVQPNGCVDAPVRRSTWSQTTNICSLGVVDTPYGPREITKFRQVSLPKDLMDRAHLRPGDKVYVAWNDALPGTLLVIPIEIVSEWIRLGQQAYESSG